MLGRQIKRFERALDAEATHAASFATKLERAAVYLFSSKRMIFLYIAQDKVLGTFFKEFVSGYKVVFKDIGAGI